MTYKCNYKLCLLYIKQSESGLVNKSIRFIILNIQYCIVRFNIIKHFTHWEVLLLLPTASKHAILVNMFTITLKSDYNRPVHKIL